MVKLHIFFHNALYYGKESRVRGEIQTIRESQQFTTKGTLKKKTKQKILIAEDASKKLTTTKSLFRSCVPFPPICNRGIYAFSSYAPTYISSYNNRYVL